ncbi:hypothetical protein PR202_gb15467 [Eleusine coracana subsp. coracana]|uniref:RING-type E3 ubiquitin transferase n=1 Tax=Eleusine coracana subsp. coracana TaxID=191504 RepID=A0AAV5EXP1_ELECO|nr:hypothetical protein QOZ80_4BG0346700 [Eleusine coracana subsp. coracana]GJN27440.1 hypothetical protein PR202_gb15467 [Eleusine coracana subsp. coracana]
MRRLRGRRLHRDSGEVDGGCDADDCWSTPWTRAPAPAPAAPPPIVRASPEPCPPEFATAPSPAPVRTAGGGRRDQGRPNGYGSPPAGGGGSDNHQHRLLVTYALAAAAAIAFLSLLLLGVSVVIRRRQVRRRRRQAALLAAPAGPPSPPDADDPEFGGGGGGGVVHHVWYIRTVGLDEAAIGSIAATRYRAGAGLLGAADCTVCLGEFQDGELVRLLPKCGHAFHVPCIDTWLRAHVNCPLCRSDVLDPAVTADAAEGGGGESGTTPPPDPVDEDDSTAVVEQEDVTSEAMPEQQQEENDPEASPAVEDQHEQQSSLPDQPPPQLPRALPHNVRRAASMDAAIVSTAVDVAAALERLPEAAPEEEQNGRRKRGTGPSCVKASGSGQLSNLGTDRPASGGIPRSFFYRHCRARSSVSPL